MSDNALGLFSTIIALACKVRGPLVICCWMLFLVAGAVPFTRGPLAAPAAAQAGFPASCGRDGQRPCKVWEHIPSCMPGLVEVALTRCKKDQGDIVRNVRQDVQQLVDPNGDPSCGGLGQQACVTSCDRGLMLYASTGSCIQNQSDIIKMSRNMANEIGPVLEVIGRTLLDCGVETIVRGLDARNTAQAQAVAQRLVDRNCLSVVLDEANRAGYQTLTIGYGGGGSLLVGGEAEAGIAYDTGFRYMPSAYGVLGISVGAQAGASPASVIVSLYKGSNQPGPGGFGGDAQGAAWEGRFAVGGGMAVWWDYMSEFQGASIAIGAGLEFQGAYVRNTTSIYNPLQVAWNSARGGGGQQVAAAPIASSYSAPPPTYSPRYDGYDDAPQNDVNAIASSLGALAATINEARAEAEAEAMSRTTMQVCNKAKFEGEKIQSIWVAVAYWRAASMGGAEGWFAEGWWEMKKNKCVLIALPAGPNGEPLNYTVQVYGESMDLDRSWQGDGLNFCIVDGSKLAMRSADVVPCDGPNQRRVQGMPFEVGPGGFRLEFDSGGAPGRPGI